jgi:hypothetical protein
MNEEKVNLKNSSMSQKFPGKLGSYMCYSLKTDERFIDLKGGMPLV